MVDQFFPSALINAGIFWWLAFLVLIVRLFTSYGYKISWTLFLGILFGPLALFIPLLQGKKNKHVSYTKSLIIILLHALVIDILFYVIFIVNFNDINFSSETLVKNIAIFMICCGLLSGITIAILTKKIALLESAFVVAMVSLSSIMISSWVEEMFIYATSSTYFITISFTLTSLLLLFLIIGGSIGYLFAGEKTVSFWCEWFIGTRFLMTKRSSNVISLITMISVFAVIIACSGMILVMSVMNGFSSEFKDKVLSANPHLMLLKYGKDFYEYEEIIAQTKSLPLVSSASAFIINEGMVSSNKNLAGAMITGIDLDHISREGRFKYVSDEAITYLQHPQLIHKTIAHDAENILPAVILGKEMAMELQVLIGDVVNIVSPLGEIGPSGPIPRAKPFIVAGFFASGMYEFDSKFIYISLAEAQQFFSMANAVTGIEYRMLDVDKTPLLARQLEDMIGGYPYYTRDWMQLNRPMFSALQLEKIAMMVILSTYIFMASLLILVTLIMVVMEKGKEIAILKSMGFSNVSIMKIFVSYGLSIGVVGALLGGLLGYVLCQIIAKIGIRLDADVYYFSHLPVLFRYYEGGLVIVAAMLISFLATIPPALFAASLKPVEGLRYQ